MQQSWRYPYGVGAVSQQNTIKTARFSMLVYFVTVFYSLYDICMARNQKFSNPYHLQSKKPLVTLLAGGAPLVIPKFS